MLADALPGLAVDFEIGIVNDDDEVRIAGGDFDALNLHAGGQGDDAWSEDGNAHAGGDFNGDSRRDDQQR